jgi:hypothetical protein
MRELISEIFSSSFPESQNSRVYYLIPRAGNLHPEHVGRVPSEELWRRLLRSQSDAGSEEPVNKTPALFPDFSAKSAAALHKSAFAVPGTPLIMYILRGFFYLEQILEKILKAKALFAPRTAPRL